MLIIRSALLVLMIFFLLSISLFFLFGALSSYSPFISLRVITTPMPKSSHSDLSSFAYLRFSSLSVTPLLPIAPPSRPPCPASMTMVYSGFGDAVALTVMQMPKHKQIKIKAINIAHNVRFFIVINLIFIKIYYYKSKKFITFWHKVLKFILSLV